MLTPEEIEQLLRMYLQGQTASGMAGYDAGQYTGGQKDIGQGGDYGTGNLAAYGTGRGDYAGEGNTSTQGLYDGLFMANRMPDGLSYDPSSLTREASDPSELYASNPGQPKAAYNQALSPSNVTPQTQGVTYEGGVSYDG